MKFSVLGPGRWGSFIAWYLNKNNNNVILWGRPDDQKLKTFIETKQNEYVTLPDSIELSSDLEHAIDFAEYVIISISSQGVRDLMQKIVLTKTYLEKKYILCMKGIEDRTGSRLSSILIEFGIPKENIAVWVGPGHIQGFVEGTPSAMVIDSYNPDLSLLLAQNLSSNLIKFYRGNDIIGTEIGAAAKNVMGIAAGILDGMDFPSLKGALMARGAHEISVLIEACGGKRLSAYGLCHLGDYEATLFSKYSHNRMFGEMLAKDGHFDKLAEGVATSSALLVLAEKHNVELPITKMVYDVINKNITKQDAIKQLFERKNIDEFKI